jgi:hypothetical protein
MRPDSGLEWKVKDFYFKINIDAEGQAFACGMRLLARGPECYRMLLNAAGNNYICPPNQMHGEDVRVPIVIDFRYAPVRNRADAWDVAHELTVVPIEMAIDGLLNGLNALAPRRYW